MPTVETVKIKAGDFSTRSDLELYVSGLYGLTPEIKKDVSIEGSKKELKKLQLSHSKLFWGIVCIENGYTQKKKKVNEADRGKIHKFGINGDFQDSEKIIN